MENLLRLRILSINIFNFMLFVQAHSNSAMLLKYHSYESPGIRFDRYKSTFKLLYEILENEDSNVFDIVVIVNTC